MASGVMVNAECQTAFQQLSEAKKYRYIIYKIVENEVVVEVALTAEEIGTTDDSYEDNSKAAYEIFVKDIKDKTDGFQDCRYAVFDFKFQTHRPGAGTSKMDKIVFIQVFFEINRVFGFVINPIDWLYLIWGSNQGCRFQTTKMGRSHSKMGKK
ncbi:unnamed protein product [Meloidogyne enterolobii]|uniref:Uncharacterized protein n=2 Tax=Meloidogyne enterolobii TaxID=390850 RepID=A0ACB0XUE0_MELEN